MPQTMPHVTAASQRDSLASVRGTTVKASLSPQVRASQLPELADVAIKKGHGKNLAAAEVLGLSESHLGRLVNDGDLKLKQLEALGPATCAAFGRQLVETYEPLATPKARAKQKIREARAALDELDQVVELIA